MDKRICYVKPGGCICDLAVVSEGFVPCDGCTEYALVSPSDLSALETEDAELKAACELKDGALELAQKCLSVCAEDAPLDVGHEIIQFFGKAQAALSLTPESVKRETEDARVGRAVEEWVKMQQECLANGGRILRSYYLLRDIAAVIAQAREGEA